MISPELAGGDHVARQGQKRVLQVVVADLRADTLRLRRLHHGAGVLGMGRDGFLAMDMLAGGDGGQRHLAMDQIGGGDGDDLDGGVGDQLAPVLGHPLEAELAMGLPARLGIVVGDDLQHRPQLEGKDAGNRAIGERMGPAHEARADDADADVAHG